MGSSRFAALSAARWLRAAGVDAHVEYASATLALPPSPETLVVAISASGASEETVAALRAPRRDAARRSPSPTTPSAPLGHAADAVLPLLAGEEVGGIACASYQCTLAVLLLLAARVAGAPAPEAELRAAVEAGAAPAGHARRRGCRRPVELLDGGDAIDVIGPDDRIAAVEQSALMLREAPRVRAAGCETGDWLHVDVYLSRHPGYRALLLRRLAVRRGRHGLGAQARLDDRRRGPSRSTAAGSTSRTRGRTSRWSRC